MGEFPVSAAKIVDFPLPCQETRGGLSPIVQSMPRCASLAERPEAIDGPAKSFLATDARYFKKCAKVLQVLAYSI